MNQPRMKQLLSRTVRRSLLATAAAAALLAATTSLATAQDAGQTPAQRYQADRAACLSGKTWEDRTTCLREAGAAYQEARKGKLDNGDLALYRRNAEARCGPLPTDLRQSCLLRMEGQGQTSGSVAEGGIYRELHQIVPANDPNAVTRPTGRPNTTAPSSTPPVIIIIPTEPSAAPRSDEAARDSRLAAPPAMPAR